MGFGGNGWNGFISGVSETNLEKISLTVLAKLLVYEASSSKQCLNLNCFFNFNLHMGLQTQDGGNP